VRVLYLSQWFEPEPNNSKTEGFLRALQQLGHDLTVCTGFPNYPGGKVYPNYRIRPFMRETLMGFEVHRVPLYPSHGASSVGRILNYLSFCFSAFVYGLLRAGRFDLAYVYHPPITVGLAAALFGWVRRLPFVIEIQDLWPDSVAASDMAGTSTLARVIGGICKFVYARAAGIIVQCPGMKERLVEAGVPAAKITVVYNWTDEEAIAHPTPLSVPALDRPGLTTIVYAGNLGRAQTVATIVRAARIAADSAPELRVLIVGDGVEERNLRALAAEIGADNVIFHDRVSRGEVASLYPRAAALIVSLTRQDLFSYVIPTKTQAYLAAGRPLLMAVNGDAARLVGEAEAGISVPPEDEKAMAEAMLTFSRMTPAERDAMGRRGAAYYREHLSAEQGLARTLAVMELAARDPSRPIGRDASELAA
jgi:glycosyltransferase involved in cell wall biosynthesis